MPDVQGLLGRLSAPILILLIALVAGCFSKPTPADLKDIELAKEQFSHEYIIKPKGSIYTEARHRPDECPVDSAASELYEVLFSGADGVKRADTV